MVTQALKIDKQGRQHITDLAYIIKQLWQNMMADLDLPSDSKFVAYDLLKQSKYHQFYDRALSMYWEALAQYNAHGYVGLRIVKGQAR